MEDIIKPHNSHTEGDMITEGEQLLWFDSPCKH